MKHFFYFSFLLLFVTKTFSQVPFWNETFGTGCNTGQVANGFNPTGLGSWSVASTGFNDVFANIWYISAEEGGMGIGNCGDGCTNSGNNRTLHISTSPSLFGDAGATYAAGFSSNSDVRAQSPVINCTGQNTISLAFAYILQGIPGSDYFQVQYSANGGATWSTIATPPPTLNGGCAGQGLWTGYTLTLPATANNNNNVKIGFRWQNVDPTGADPAVALDNVKLYTTAPATFAPTFTINSPICQNNSVTVNANTGTFVVSGYTWSAAPAGPTFGTPNASLTSINFPTAGTFSITLTATSGGTTAANTQTILVNPAPLLTASLNPSSICAGQSSTISGTGANSYTWNPGALNGASIVVNPTITTVYTAIGSSTAGCTATATKTLFVTTAPNLTLTPSSNTICSGSSATLTGSGAIAYTWNPGGLNGTVVVVSPTVTTTYTAIGTNSAACSGTSAVTVSVSICSTGLNSNSLNNHSYAIYPNPVSDKLFIQSSGTGIADAGVEVLDALGKTIIKQNYIFTTSNNLNALNVSTLDPGLYFVKIYWAKEIKVLRFVKE